MLELLPLRYGVKSNEVSLLEVLIRITPSEPGQREETPLNVALALDRSGSMQGSKLNSTIQAAQAVVDCLDSNDRLSIVVFDDRVHLMVASAPVSDRAALKRIIASLQAGGSTALHPGWLEAATQVAENFESTALNRVLLLTDGVANVGEVNADKICVDVNGLSQRGISTSTLGFGKDYNEILLRSMAASGDGNHYFVESPQQLQAIFELELGAMSSTLGKTVRLELEGAGPIQVLTDLQTDEGGALRLNDLILGNPITVLAQIEVGPGRSPQLTASLRYYDLQENREAHLQSQLNLPQVSSSDWDRLSLHNEVRQELAIWRSAKARREVVPFLLQGDIASVTRQLSGALEELRQLPVSAAVQRHIGEIEEVLNDVRDNNHQLAGKRAVQQQHAYSYSSVSMSQIPALKVLKKLVGQPPKK